MLFSWFTRRRRAKLLATPFPDDWLGFLEKNVPAYSRLSAGEQAALRDVSRILVAEKQWEGCGGLIVTDEIKVTIAAQAALLLLGIDHDYFARVQSILVYPTGFRSTEGWAGPDGVVTPDIGVLGQAWYDGPVLLAWDEVVAGGVDPSDGRNVVLHEFAHQLDYLDGVADGTPPLRHKGDYAKWQEVMTREFERLKSEAEYHTPYVLDSYGATNHAEFFAVATEAFFERSREMYTRLPALYAVMSEYYGQDPATRDWPDDIPLPDQPGAERKKSHRRSREAAKIEVHAQVAREWPRWVQFWEIHPGVSRAQALLPLERQVELALVSLPAFAFSVGWSYLDHWRPNALMLLSALFCMAMLGLAVWLRLAVRWVDRKGTWGGEYRPGEVAEDPEAGEPAPLG